MVVLRIQDQGIAKYEPVFERLEARMLEMSAEYPGFTLTLEGC